MLTKGEQCQGALLAKGSNARGVASKGEQCQGALLAKGSNARGVACLKRGAMPGPLLAKGSNARVHC